MTENKTEYQDYNAEIVTDKEVKFAKNSNKKVLVIIMRCMFGPYGVDKFIMGCTKKGVEDIIITAALIGIQLFSLVFLLIPFIGYGIFCIVAFFVCAVLFIRMLYSFISGLRMIKLTPREIAEKYERMM